jgi:membrane dipeptidase
MMSFWLTRDNPPTAEHLVAHIRHVIKVGGIDAVAIANDFPMAGQSNLVKLGNDNAEGVKEYLPWWKAMRDSGIPGFERPPEHVVIPEFNTIDRLSRIHATLDRAGFRPSEIDRIMGGNWQRVLTDVLG